MLGSRNSTWFSKSGRGRKAGSGRLAAEARGIRLGGVRGHDATHYPLSLMVRPGDELQLRLDYRPDLFDGSSVAVLAERLVRLLAAAASAPQRPVGMLSILAAAERSTILSVWNDTAVAVAAATLPELFAALIPINHAASRRALGQRVQHIR